MKEIHLFDLDVYVEANKQIKNLLLKQIKNQNLSLTKLSKLTGIARPTISSVLKNKSMRTKNFRKILHALNIKEREFETLRIKIFSSPYKHYSYQFSFPIKLTPLHIRLIGHVMGDGCLEKRSCRWYQKNEFGGKSFVDLIYFLSSIEITKTKKDAYGIPNVLLDIISSAFNLRIDELKTHKFIHEVIKLPLEYRLQFLTAIIVDEGHISKSSIKISNTDLRLLKALKKLIESLSYSCSRIKHYKNNVGETIIIKGQECKVNKNLKDVYLHADALLKFKEDLSKMISRYGFIAGLWHKQSLLESWSMHVNLDKLTKRRNSQRKLIPLIKKQIKQKPIKVKDFAKQNNIPYGRAYKLFFRLKEKDILKKIGIGIFSSSQFKGPNILSLKEKIERALTQSPKSVKEIAKNANGNSKSVATQLNKFLKQGKVKRIKRGIYRLV